MKRITSLFVFLLLFSLQAIIAQDIQISGTVTSSEDGSPLPGASVVIKGTTAGIATDINGQFSLRVPSDAILVFSSVGMVSQEIPVNGRTQIDVVMAPELIGLDEVVIVAYGTIRKEANTGSVGVVSSEALQDIPEISVDKLLSGKVAGVQVTSTTGQPGSNSQVRIRGISSIYAGNQPLYVVDGIPIMEGDQSVFTNTSNTLSAINPNDIESISVLKDAAAASVYGSRAANGVILITTKSGKSGKSQFNLRTSFGMEKLANDNGFGVLSPVQYIDYYRDAIVNAGLDPDLPSSPYYLPYSMLEGPTTNWLEEFTRTGQIFNVELSASGGNEKTTTYFSGSYNKHEGAFYGVDFQKFQFRSNIDHKINDKLDLGVKINAAHTYANDVAMQSLYYVNPIFAGIALSPFTRMKNDDGSYNLDDFGYWANTNPAANTAYDEQWEKQYRMNGNISLGWKIIEGLSFKTINSYEYTGSEGRRYWSAAADPTVDKGTLQTSRRFYQLMTTSNTLNYRKLIDKHSIQAIAGQEASTYYYNYFYLSSPDVDPEIPFPTTATSDADDGDYAQSEYTLLSYFGILYYNFDNKYFLQGSVRSDGSSRFGADTKWGTFYSVSASWNISNESFMENISQIDLLKFRASYGLSGNYNIGNYDQYGLYSSYQYNGVSGMAPSQVANPDLGWENNGEYNFALDFGVMKRVTGTFEYYHRSTTDMLLDYPLSLTSGFPSVRTNIGQVDNTGFEVLVNVNALKTSDITVDFGFNLAHNNSEIIDLGKDEEFINVDNNRIIHRKGEHLYSFYLYDYAGVNPANGEALWWDENGELTNLYANARRIIAGSPEPKFTGGFNALVNYKGLELSAFLEFKTGNQVLLEEGRYLTSDGYWWPRNQTNTSLDYWKEPGDVTLNPKPVLFNSSNSSGYRSTRHMQNGDYLRVKNITLSYTLPKKWVNTIKLENVRIYGSAVNLYTFHDVDWWDPERGEDGTGFGIYPQTKKIIFGLELSF
ncbi:MAG: TonB-dependent receptor [Bacteroidales bacterium]|nr:TonB-dependent receptor [Bacteroidales bacterium]